MMRLTKETMLALGFQEHGTAEVPAQCRGHSPYGDNVWLHQESGVWFQGVPGGEQLFRAVYLAGKKAGSQARLQAILDALEKD